MKKGFLLLFTMVLSFNAFADICGKTDDRIPSNDPRVGKITKFGKANGCTISLIGNNCALTAGNCADMQVAQFNVPASVESIPQLANSVDQYEVENGQYFVDGVGTNWGVVKLRPNSITGKSAHEVQGKFTYIQNNSKKKSRVKVISYGLADNNSYPVQSGSVPANKDAEILNYAQQVSFGEITKIISMRKISRIDHNADTGVASAGAAIIDIDNDTLIGIGTHGGCRVASQSNSGTLIYKNKDLESAIKYCIERK